MKIPKPVIYVVGNAPIALISLMDASSENGYRPAFIIGVPGGICKCGSGEGTGSGK